MLAPQKALGEFGVRLTNSASPAGLPFLEKGDNTPSTPNGSLELVRKGPAQSEQAPLNNDALNQT